MTGRGANRTTAGDEALRREDGKLKACPEFTKDG